VRSTGLTGVSAGPVHILGTGLTGGDDRSDRCELKLLPLPCFQLVCMHSSRGEVHWFRGHLHVCRGSSLILKTARGILRISKVSHAFIYKGHQVKGHVVELIFTNKLMHLNL
jgi:hypothetical protein